ncbi:MAG: polyphosphate polymerase domain-containing protein [Caldilineaceae bacterium]
MPDYPGAADEVAPSGLAPTSSTTERRLALSPAIQQALGAFTPLPLEELDYYALLSRMDTKFVLTERQALEIFAAIGPHYRVLEVQGRRSGHYYTRYFDTQSLRMYHDHHNGLRERHKVRTRTYLDSGACFLEIKIKNNHERTDKRRMPVPLESDLSGAAAQFVRAHTPFDPTTLTESLTNEFLRVTLVGVDSVERLTIDFGFTFQWRGRRGTLPGLVIAEVKQPRFSSHSGFVRQLRARHIEPTPFSKYCIGLVLLDSQVRYNQFKPLLFHLQRLLQPYTSGQGVATVSGVLPAASADFAAPIPSSLVPEVP